MMKINNQKAEHDGCKGCAYENYSSHSMECCGCIQNSIDKYRKKTNEELFVGWIPVEERLPENTVNPITRDAYVYPVTVDLGGITDIRYYSFCRGHWYNQGPKKMDELVIAWMPLPEPYRPEN